jgi:adenosine kinase
MEGAYCMVVNAYEAELITSKTGLSLDDLRDSVEILGITHGGSGSHIYQNGDLIEVPVFPIDEIKDPTGAGDAYRAGLLRGMAAGFPLKLAGEMGALVAAYVLEQTGTQNHHFTIHEFVNRFRTHFSDNGLLDKLLQHQPA